MLLAERPHLREKVMPLHAAGRVELVADEAEVAPSVRVVPTPGYTPGHMSVRMESDVVVHQLQVGDPSMRYVSADPKLAQGHSLGWEPAKDEGAPVE